MKKYTIWERIKRLLRLKLIVPLLRSPHPPEYKARGVAIGLMWAMTPLVGIQMWLVLMTWLTARKLFKWDFSLGLGLAWTWVTNVFTMVPCYYLFYVTGQILQGKFHSISGYENLARIIRSTFLSDLSFVDEWLLFFKLLAKDWGISMALGCLPWMAVMTIVGYYMTIGFEEQRAKKKMLKGKNNATGI